MDRGNLVNNYRKFVKREERMAAESASHAELRAVCSALAENAGAMPVTAKALNSVRTWEVLDDMLPFAPLRGVCGYVKPERFLGEFAKTKAGRRWEELRTEFAGAAPTMVVKVTRVGLWAVTLRSVSSSEKHAAVRVRTPGGEANAIALRPFLESLKGIW